MAHETEAAALLRSGRLFPRRVGLRASAGDLTFVGVRHGAFAIHRGDEPYYHFDLEGRWQRAFVEGMHYRKALSGSVDALDRLRESSGMVLSRRTLSFAETTALDASIRREALSLADGLEAGALELVPPPEGGRPLSADDLRDLLGRVARWDAAAWFAQRERHFETYAPIGLLPPDAHTSVVLQATVGDASGSPFGGGAPQAHLVRDPERFEDHVRAVLGLLGRGLSRCRAVFLGGPDALRRPLEQIVPWFEIIRRSLPLDPSAGRVRLSERAEDDVRLSGIDTFLHEFAPPLPDRRGWAELKRLGLGRVNLGVESGDPTLRALYGRAWTEDDLRGLVANLKDEGIALGLLLLIGTGGREHADRHVGATCAVVDDLPFGRGDLVYLIDADELAGPAPEGSSEPLAPGETSAQREEFKALLKPLASRTGAKVVEYSPRKQSD